jgi:hypothetical protein
METPAPLTDLLAYCEVTMPDRSPVTVASPAGGHQTISTIGEAESLYVEVSALIWRDSIQAATFPATPDPRLAETQDILSEALQRTLGLDLAAFLNHYDSRISAACRQFHDGMADSGEHPLIHTRATTEADAR